MKLKKALTFKFITAFILFSFLLNQALFYSPAYAETPCWNDGTNCPGTGGSDILPGAQKGEFDPLNSEKVDDPVNIATGNYSYESTDLSIPSRGPAISLKRFYNSKDDYNGPFGIGWSHSYNMFLIEAVDEGVGYVICRNPGGSKIRFTKDTDGTFSSPAGIFDTLTKNAQGRYIITTKHGLKYLFNEYNFLASITDRNNNAINLTYDPATRALATVGDTLGKGISFEYTAERKVSRVRDFSGRRWEYGYSNGDLTSVTAPATDDFPYGTTTYYAYQEHNLTSITDPRGNSYLGITYDTQGRVDAMTQGNNTYNFSFSKGLTVRYDPKGNRTDYILNDDGTTNKKIEYADNNYETAYEYNSDKLVTKVTYPEGNSAVYSYDTKGNLLQVTRKPKPGSLEADIITVNTYEPRFNFIKSTTDARLNTIEYFYDYEETVLGDLNGDGITNQQNGNLVKVKSSLPGIETKLTYNSYGQLVSVTDPNGKVTRNEYDAATGYLLKTTKSYGELNLATEMFYDALGNIISVKDPKGNITGFQYDSHNNLIKSIAAAPFNYITTYKYDENDNLIQLDKETGDLGNPWQTTYYTYDIMDRPEVITDDAGNTTVFSYDANGNRTKVRDAELNCTDYIYNARNLLWKVIDAEGNTTEYAYNANGNLTQIKDARYQITQYAYDDFGRLVKTTYDDGSFESYAYDANSNLISKTTPKGETIYYEYDVLNRLSEKGLSPQGSVPESIVNYSYDSGSRLIDIVDAKGTIHYDFDPANRVTQVVYSGGLSPQGAVPTVVSYEYDSNSNRTKLTYPDSTYITYQYDQLNRLTAVKDQAGVDIAAYLYDALSRRAQLDYANGTQTRYTYDDINRLINLKGLSPQGAVFGEFGYTYDKVGNRKTMTTPQGVHTYTYDTIYQLKAVDYPAGYPFADTNFNYDSVGNRTSVEGLTQGSVPYDSNSLNQYTQVGIDPYSYDVNGNLTYDGSNTYNYDFENRLIEGTVPDRGLSLSFDYDALGRRIEKSVNGADTKFVYDGDQIIAEYDGSGNLTAKYIFGPGIDEPICRAVIASESEAIYFYHFDGLGSVISLTDSSGSVVENYSYDVFGTPSAVSSLGNRYMFTGREYDVETGLYYYRARYYSPAIGRFLQRDPVGYTAGINLYSYCDSVGKPIIGTNLYAYVDNNPVNFVDPWGLCKENKDKPWWPKWSEVFIPGYGNYGGPFRTDPTFQIRPEDSMDRLFMQHDIGWSQGRGREADRILLRELYSLPSNPRNWGEPPQTPWVAGSYRRFIAEPYFWWRNLSLGDENGK